MFLTGITKGADLTLVFIDELNEETFFMSNHYKIADKKTTIFIKRPFLLHTLSHMVCNVSMLYSKALSYMVLRCTGLANALFLIESQNFETHGFR